MAEWISKSKVKDFMRRLRKIKENIYFSLIYIHFRSLVAKNEAQHDCMIHNTCNRFEGMTTCPKSFV